MAHSPVPSVPFLPSHTPTSLNFVLSGAKAMTEKQFAKMFRGFSVIS